MSNPQPYRRSFVDACLAISPPPARQWIAGFTEVASGAVASRAAEVDRRAAYPHESVAALRAAGAFGLLAPVSAGGLNLGLGAAALAVEITAASCASTAAILLFHHQVVRRVIHYGSRTQLDADLPRLASGAVLGVSAWSEPAAGAHATRVATQLTAAASGWRADGRKTYCTGLEGCGIVHVLLMAPDAQGIAAPTFARVRADAPGVDRSEIYSLMGLRGSSTGSIGLHEVAVADADIVGERGAGLELMKHANSVLLNPGLLALGIASAAFEQARGAVAGRWPGLPKMTPHQSARFAIADMEMRLGAGYSYAAEAVRAAHANLEHADVECLKVKAHVSALAAAITADVVDLLGTRGVNGAWPVERLCRDARATVLMGPTAAAVKERVASLALF